MREQLEPLFNPRSVAVIGATNHWNKWGFSTWNSIQDGFRGKVYPVNHREETVVGRRAYAKVTDIPEDEPVDVAVFVIPAQGVPSVMEDCVRKGVRGAVVISAGFAETGEEGRKLQDEVVRVARKGPIRFIGGNCMGFWSASAHLRAFMFPLPVKDGPLALVSQGGNIGGNVVSTAFERGLGFRSYVSCGCTADIQIEDYIEYLGDDPEVRVIMAYIEGLVDGARFIRKVRKVSAKKPVIALKPGRTVAATRAITSHSGSMAGASGLYDSAFKKAGVLRVNTPEELLDVAVGFVTQPRPRGRKVAIISPGGSYGVLTADACASAGLDVITLSQGTIRELDKIFPPRWSRGNPVDPAGDRDFIAYMQAPDLLLKQPEVDALLYMGFSNFAAMAQRFSGVNEQIAKAYRALVMQIASMVPEEDGGAGISGEADWAETLIGKMVQIFFAAFGTSSARELEAFSRKLTGVLHAAETGANLRRHMVEAARSLRQEPGDPLANPFGEVFQSLMEGLCLQWMETYGKPVVTTGFMETPTVSRMGYHAYATPERAALVLTKMIEYGQYRQRTSSKADGQTSEAPNRRG